jgi:hypothetical protein
MLYHGELPTTLKPVLIEAVESLDFGPGQGGKRGRKGKEVRFRVVDYLTAVGVDLKVVKEVHLHGGGDFAVILSPKELRRIGDRLYFGYGNVTSGKPLLYTPADLKAATTFDQLRGVAVYIKKKPPKQEADGGLVLDGKPIQGIPYFGEPLRGGVRVYKDDRFAFLIKRKNLAGGPRVVEEHEGQQRFRMLPYFETQGVVISDVADAELIYDDVRMKRLEGDALKGAFFTADPQASGQVLLGADRAPVEAVALYTKAFRGKHPARPLVKKVDD